MARCPAKTRTTASRVLRLAPGPLANSEKNQRFSLWARIPERALTPVSVPVLAQTETPAGSLPRRLRSVPLPPGLASVSTKSAPVSPWLPGSYSGTVPFARGTLRRIPAPVLAAAWILTTPDGPRRLPETELLRERAAQAIADALERSAQMIEEAETRVNDEEAASRLLYDKIGCLPVVDRDQQVIGIVTETDFLEIAHRALTLQQMAAEA